jgi:hypothetical protein
MFGNLIFITLVLGSGTAAAQSSMELFFPIQKSNVQILPQRFEYQLLSKDQLRLGNILIDARQIAFQIHPGDGKGKSKLRFNWPAGLLDRGEIVIKDNSGKGIWFQKINPDKVEISEDETQASLETVSEAAQLLSVLSLYPFFRFCVQREENRTKTFLCSKDLFLRKVKNKYFVQQRDSYRPQSFVEINGQAVGDQGMIFLNSPSEPLSFRTLLLSGATLEIETRMKKINFKDVYLSDDEQSLIVRAQGTKPVDPSLVEAVPGGGIDEWQARLEVERPSTYLKSEGDLPLRQEFLIQGNVRKSLVKVQILRGQQNPIFKEEHELKLKPTEGLELENADKKSRLSPSGEGTYAWTLFDLKRNENNRRYIKVKAGEDTYFAAYDLERWAAWDAGLRIMTPLWLQVHALHTPSVRWGLTAQWDQQLDHSRENSLKLATIGGQFRFPEGLHLKDPQMAAEVYVQSFQNSEKSLLLYGLGLQAELPPPKDWTENFPWTLLRARVPLGTSDSQYSIQNSLETELSFRWFFSKERYWELGARNQTYLLKTETETEDMTIKRTMNFIGVGQVF